jgi:nucleotide-binding universal stress UspA family protein
MFKHLLIPTDGSAASEHAMRRALALAREGNSQVTGLHVISPFHLASYEVDMIEETRASYEANVRARARKYLDAIERCAAEMSVSVRTRIVVADHPYEAIIAVAVEAGCDLIVMASHGERGTKGVLLGGETQKVLTHSTLPVLVLR